MNRLYRFTYRSDFLAIARLLHLTGPLRKLYHRWAVSPDGVYRANVMGVNALFHAATPEQIRGLESELLREMRFLLRLIGGSGLAAIDGPRDQFGLAAVSGTIRSPDQTRYPVTLRQSRGVDRAPLRATLTTGTSNS